METYYYIRASLHLLLAPVGKLFELTCDALETELKVIGNLPWTSMFFMKYNPARNTQRWSWCWC